MRRKATAQTARYGAAHHGTAKITRLPPSTAVTLCRVAATLATVHAQYRPASNSVMTKGAAIPNGACTRPVDPSRSPFSGASSWAPVSDGPHLGQASTSTKRPTLPAVAPRLHDRQST